MNQDMIYMCTQYYVCNLSLAIKPGATIDHVLDGIITMERRFFLKSTLQHRNNNFEKCFQLHTYSTFVRQYRLFRSCKYSQKDPGYS